MSRIAVRSIDIQDGYTSDATYVKWRRIEVQVVGTPERVYGKLVIEVTQDKLDEWWNRVEAPDVTGQKYWSQIIPFVAEWLGIGVTR